ncbi:branched-chain amino acid ABC transporter permease [bacterium]|nr:branched-chain amino acid ABC transporter permease [bacterium]
MIGQIIQAVLLGGYYALTAAGLTFMLQVMRVINLAHGSLSIAFAYAVYTLAFRYHINPFLGLLMVLPVAAAVGWALQRLLLERAARGGELLPILSTFGLAIVLDNVMFQIFGANAKGLAQFLGDLSFAAYELPGKLYVGKLPVWILAAAVCVLGGLHLMLTRTGLGRRIRATAMDPVTAGLVGVDARQSAAIAAAIAMMMVAMSGVALGFRTVFDAYAGGPQLLFAFEATIIGGARSLWGVFVGAMVLAFAQTGAAMLHPQAFLLGGHVMFLVVLFARLALGQGSLGTRLRQVVRGA